MVYYLDMNQLEKPAPQEIRSSDHEPISAHLCYEYLGIDAGLVAAFSAGDSTYGIFRVVESAACLKEDQERLLPLGSYVIAMFDENDPNKKIIPESVKVLELGENEFGRASDLLYVNDTRISREHAIIIVDENGVTIKDSGSRNGTNDILEEIRSRIETSSET